MSAALAGVRRPSHQGRREGRCRGGELSTSCSLPGRAPGLQEDSGDPHSAGEWGKPSEEGRQASDLDAGPESGKHCYLKDSRPVMVTSVGREQGAWLGPPEAETGPFLPLSWGKSRLEVP